MALWRLYGITEEERLKGTEGSKVEGREPFGVVYTGSVLCKADLALFNGNIYTMDRRRPQVSAVAMAGDRFLAVGSDTEMRALLSPGRSGGEPARSDGRARLH